MSIAPKDSQIKLTPAQEAEVMKLNSVQEINQFMRDAALAQSLVRPLDAAHPDILVDVLQPTRKTATIALDGQTYEFSADSDEELTRLQLEFMRGRNNNEAAATTTAKTVAPKTEPVRDNTGRFATQKDPALSAADKATLELKFKRGEISASDYLLQSGAMEEYVERLQERAGQAAVQSWAQATEAFKQGPGANWPGGDNNRERLGHKLAELGLTEATDKVDALTQAWRAMQAEDALKNYKEEMSKANSHAEMEAVRAKYFPQIGIGTNAGGVNGGGGYFGGS
jgi:hypothetical protein